MAGPRNQQIVVTQGQIDDYEAEIASLKAGASAAVTVDASAEVIAQNAALVEANKILLAKNAELQTEVDAIKAAIK